jgi:hypothetical protein
MTSLAFADCAGGRPRAFPGSDLLERRGSDVLLGVVVMAVTAALLAFLPSSFSVDSWLALTAGREVWQTGIPHHETLTALSQGHVWIDQQWLSELASYGIYRFGGLGLLGLTNVFLMASAIAAALAGARRLGASTRAPFIALPVCLWLTIPSREVRTQAFVLPLFVATFFLLASDSRRTSKAVYLCLPLLALWANLHGTVTIGAALVVLRGLTLLPTHRRRALILIVGAPVCLLLTPYGLDALSYYRTMFLQSSVRHTVTEWQPITSAWLVAGPFFAAAGATLWCFGRFPSRTTLWERLALIALAAGSVLVIRNVLFFGLASTVVLPLSFASTPKTGRVRPAVNGALALAVLAVVLLSAVYTLARPASVYEFHYQRAGVLGAVQRITSADRSVRVLADVRFADWLLWRDPALAGRVANDARFELLSGQQASQLQELFAAVGPDWKAAARGYRLIVLDRTQNPDAVAGFLAEPGARRLYDDGERVVILRAPGIPR